MHETSVDCKETYADISCMCVLLELQTEDENLKMMTVKVKYAQRRIDDEARIYMYIAKL